MRRQQLLRTGLLVLALLAGAVTAAAAPQRQTASPPAPLEGKALYVENCAPCHGSAGRGDGPSAAELGVAPTAFADREAVAGKSLVELFEITREGNMPRMMPPWKNRLTDAEIWKTVAYAWTLQTSPEELALGQQVYADNCLECHGAGGSGGTSGASLADFGRTSSVSMAAWSKTLAEGKGAMPAFGEKLAQPEQQAVLVYARSLSFGGPLFRGPLASGTGVISGTVTNATTGTPAAGLEVELAIFDETALLEQRTALTDATGLYRVTGLPTDPGLVFAARVVGPGGVPYSTDFLGFEQDRPELDLPITIYDTTSDSAGITAERIHYIVEFEAGRALIGEVIVLSLAGNRAYVGEGGAVLRFRLPPGATDLAVDGDDGRGRFQATEDGFVDRLPLSPGRSVRQLLFRYAVPYEGQELLLVWTVPYATTRVNALISDVGQTASSNQLVEQEPWQTESGTYRNLAGADLPAGQQLSVRLAKLPAASAASPKSGTGGAAAAGASGASPAILWVLIGIAAAAAGLLVALPLIRRGRAAATGAEGRPDRDALLDELAQLDLAHETGAISDAVFRDRRLRLKAQLRDLAAREGRG